MAIKIFEPQPQETTAQRMARWAMGGTMVFAGLSHLTFARRAFRKQVPRFVPNVTPLTVDQVVVGSGIVEMSMGASLVLLPQHRKALGWVLGAFYVAILPGNIAQWQHHRTAFGLDTDRKRFLRLFGQPLLVALALWSTGALDRTRTRQLTD